MPKDDATLSAASAGSAMRYASVCDGIGAAHVAWQPLGWQCQWTSEIEPFPAAVVEHHYGFRNLGDMTAITEAMLDAPVELLVGGTPCQSFSVAGLRGGLADPRGNLALRFVQLAAVMQPKWIVWENVPGVLSSGKGRDFGTFLGALGELGYGFAYRVLDAQWFGVAQRRRRVFVVGYLGDWRRAAAVLFERESVFGNPPTRRKAREGVASSTAVCPQVCRERVNALTARMGTSGGHSNGDVDGHRLIAFHPTQDPISSVDGSTHAMGCGSKGGCSTQAVATPIDLRQASRGDKVTNNRASGSGGPPGHGVGDGGDPAFTVSERGQAVAFTAKDCGGDATQDVAPTMRAMGHSSSHANGGGQLAVAFTKSKRAQSTTDDETWVPGEVSPTMSCFDQGDTRATTVVAFTQNCRDEVRQINGDGQIAGALNADSGSHQTNYVAYAIDGGNQAASEEVHHSLRTGRDSGDAVAFKPSHYTRGKDGAPSDVTAPLSADADKGDQDTVVAQGFTFSGYSNKPAWMTGDRTDCLPASGHSDGSHQGVGVATNMAVRRLTPRECERLQGFPDDYTLVEYRKKPAADGPRYRALGNSMAVPVMRWIGERIQQVDRL
jgi:DNA (cytosine-5)-methyltransferase 1